IETWARSIGGRFARSGEAMTVTTPQRVVTVETLDGDLRDGLAALPLDDADGVAASALLDLVADDWLTAAAATLAERGLPALFSLTVDGRLGWTPGAAEDSAIAAAFARDLRRDKGFGRAVGADAPAVAAQVLAAAGYRVETAPSDWRIAAAAEDTAMHRALLSFIVPAVRAQPPEGTNVAAWSALLDAWEGEKRSLVDAAGLDLTVGHTDLLAVT
ncbi:MAG: class I SAM-dependent methyltransferase, partial [Alphaproteobacteria bacterium]